MKAIAISKPHAVAVVAQPSTATAVMALIERAVLDPAFDVAKMEALLKVKERLDAEEARKAFVRALAQFKENPPIVLKSKQVKFTTNAGTTQYRHATLGATSAIIGAHLSKYGLSHRWNTQQADGKIKVTCILTHELGHSESVSMEAPYDQSGGKNAIQAIVSAKSYLERHTLNAVTGMAAQDEDDDGRASGKPPVPEPIPGPKEAKKSKPAAPPPAAKPKEPEAPTKGQDSFTIKVPFLFGKLGNLVMRGPLDHQKYRIDDATAKTSKANFQDGDTAEVAWEIRDGVKHVADLDRKAGGAAGF